MLTGRMPFTGQSTKELRQRIKFEPTPKMKDFYPPINSDLQFIVERALAKDPMMRYQSCEEFGNFINDYMRKRQLDRLERKTIHKLIRNCNLILFYATVNIPSGRKSEREDSV